MVTPYLEKYQRSEDQFIGDDPFDITAEEIGRVQDVIKELMAVRIKFEDERHKDDFSNIKHMLVNKYPLPENLL